MISPQQAEDCPQVLYGVYSTILLKTTEGLYYKMHRRLLWKMGLPAFALYILAANDLFALVSSLLHSSSPFVFPVTAVFMGWLFAKILMHFIMQRIRSNLPAAIEVAMDNMFETNRVSAPWN